jgi:peptidoglycan/xylan/chitin deacetylase (PgdA/CDA1 family)
MPLLRPGSIARTLSLIGPAAALAAACAGSPARVEPSTGQVAASPVAATARAGAPAPSAPPRAPAKGENAASPDAGVAVDRGETVETACNGVDDDGDGLVDVLLPVKANACETSLLGACAHGHAACEGGQKVCLGPSPTPEVLDGIDNDCNGVVDDVPAGVALRPRALVIAPRYAWTDAAPDIATVSSVLAQAGIPYDLQPPGTDWGAAVATLDDYTMVVVPGYLVGGVVHFAVAAALERFAKRGGVVVVFKPLGNSDEPQAWKLTGLRGSARHRDVLQIRFDATRPAAVTRLDSPEERTLLVNAKASPEAVEAYLLDPDPAAGTQIVARGVGDGVAGATITRRPLGSGAVYAVGHDLYTFAASHCYVNCFEPAGDVMRLFLDGAFREGSAGHVVVKAAAPNGAPSVLVVTHDVDAPDAFREGPWGKPGALQAAEMERSKDVRATFNITTDYVTGYYHEPTVRALCEMGMCPLGGHSVTHPTTFGKLPLGTCTETVATYDGKQLTLCGEIRVSRDLVAQATGRAPRAWRSPYLDLAPHLFQTRAKNGFQYDSGFGIGDLPYNLPVDLGVVGFHQDRFEHAQLLEFPVVCEDGLGELHEGVERRTELQASNRARFASLWRYALLRNAENRSYTTLLLHPSTGRAMPPENLATKISVLAHFLDEARAAGIAIGPLTEAGDFWRARLDTSIDAHYDPASGYSGTLTVGATTSPGLTLEFGDAVAGFSCDKCGSVSVHGTQVVIQEALAPRTKAAFVARLK